MQQTNNTDYTINFVPGELLMMFTLAEQAATDESEMSAYIDEVLRAELEREGGILDQLTTTYIEILRERNEKREPSPVVPKGEMIPNGEAGIVSLHESDSRAHAVVSVRLVDGEPSSKDVIEDGIYYVSEYFRGEHYGNLACDSENFAFVSVTPNWLTPSTPAKRTSGGPGAPPIEFNASFKPIQPTILDASQNPVPIDQETIPVVNNVNVVILDTLPEYNEIEGAGAITAFLQDGNNSPSNDTEILLGKLRDKLEIHDDSFAAVYKDLELDPQTNPGILQSEVSNHGLFIASTIATIAPQIFDYQDSSLHLVQVLNRNGVGTLGSLIRGIKTALSKTNGKENVILNLSLMIAAPRELDHFTPLTSGSGDIQDAYNAFMELVIQSENNTTDQVYQFFQIVDLVMTIANSANNGAIILAAAGNDKEPTDTNRPIARYPAALKSVIGTAAYSDTDSNDYADYSNSADRPPSDGIRTLGKVVGTYLHFDSGLATWEGTSFASGVLAGLLALYVQMGVPTNAPDPLKTIKQQFIESDPAGPHLMRMQQ